jgi:uncharacterized protein YqeY
MNLTDQINQDLKEAMKAKQEQVVGALRGIKSAILLAKTEKGASDELSEDTELKILQKLAKQRKESIEIFEKEGRTDLADVEKQELAVIERYLPKPISIEELQKIVIDSIAESGATGIKEMGKVMAIVQKKVTGRADGKVISDLIKEQLN